MAFATYNQTPSSSATLPSTLWDVFINFRGSDTRSIFTDHLYEALDRHGVRTYRDDADLRSGEMISDSLVQAIRESKIYVVVFSNNYASSTWCLDELVEILNCHKTMQRLVIPVFYNIEPTVIRNQIGSFEQAFEKHQVRFAMEKVNEWRHTLTHAGRIVGWHISGNRSQTDVINKVLDKVLLVTNPMTLDVAKFTVGLDARVKDIATLLSPAEALYDENYQTPSSSAMLPSTPWDVFINFRGSDTRFTFTDHLYEALDRHGVRTYTDDPELIIGEMISDSLHQALQESKIYIVVFSENYAYSTWCLDELVEILNCHKTMQRLVIPVFYNIDPAVVRHQIGSFEDAFHNHQIRFVDEREKVRNWQLTLKEVTNFSGWHISEYSRSQTDVINEVLDRVLLATNPMTLDVAKYPVGLDARIEDVATLLSPTSGVIKIGIYGIGGIGKTTLAKAVYNENYNRFQGSCFLANVREVSETPNGPVSLQQLVKDVLKIKNITIDNVDQGIVLIRAKICRTKILVVIDDLDDLKPLEYLEGPFAVGSIIIITTRKEFLLDSIKVDARYKVNELGDAESHHLFTRHAFGDNEISDTFLELSKEILEHAGGLPLALKVFGSNLANQSEQGWRWFIGLLKRRCSLTIKDTEDLLRHMGREICNVFELMASTSYQNPFSSSYETPTRWDVFLSFRGVDTRFKFTDHLYAALDRHGVRTFKDDPELHIGDVISDALLEAIQESKIYIVVLSENYAHSGWCLQELLAIYNCYKIMKRLVIPVFYNIDPSVARHQSGSYERDFKKHEVRFAGETQKVNNWRDALTKVANFSGSHISAKSSEVDIVDQIVGEILLKINPKALGVAKYPVGLDSRVETITAKLNCTEGVTKIGIYGMGGMGKTTLAKALYNQLLRGGSFKDSCFLADVREVSETSKGLVSLQQQIIDDVLKSKKKVEVHNVEGGIKVIRDRICSAKVLLIIDDINDPKQFDCLVGPFASGSVVIITTRDEELLDKLQVEPTYRCRVNVLDDNESLALFTKHAFGNAKPNDALMELSGDILRLAGGLPLALEVFGSYLLSKQSVVGWKAYIEKLQRYPNSTIQQKLIISLDVLESDDPVLKQIFLDIACFFTGREKGEVVKIMETYYSYVDHHIDILKKRCLLTINNRDELGMHDLLRDIGRNIVRNGSPHEPEKHSRLWVSNDIYNVLKMHKGTEAIEGIIPDNFNYKDLQKGVSFTTEAFKRMSKLRFLYLNNVNLTGSFEQTFEDLRWLCWECCPLKCLPSEFFPEKLVILELRRSKLRTMWNLNMVYENLRILNMSSSLFLSTTPDFTKLPSLGTLNLEGCKILKEVHTSIGSLRKLVSLNLCGCVKLRSLPDSICNLRALKSLDIANCSSLKSLPRELGNIESLTELYAWGLTVSDLPDSISHLSKLVTLILRNNNNLESLPDKFGDLRGLETLDFRNCCRLLSVTELPPNVKWILADNCTSMERLPNLSYLKQLETFHLTNCSSLTDIQGLEELTSLRELSLGGCNSSLLAYAFTEHFFQTFSGFGHRIEIYIQSEEFPDWISQSSNSGSTVSVDLPPNVSHNFLAIILCFKLCEDTEIYLVNDLRPSYYNVQNTSSGFILQGSFDNHNHESLMVIVPRSIFPVEDGDDRIELTSDAEILGIHLMCNT